jgi:Tfp pilus assembly protein PilO
MANQIAQSTNSSSLADILERVLDKGVVIAGDIKVNLADVELLNIKIRLVVCSVDKAMEMGINWWQSDPLLSTDARNKALEKENTELKSRLSELEKQVAALLPPKNSSN